MAGLLRSLYLAYFSQPKGCRSLYRTMRKRPPAKVVEMGIGTGDRTLRMLELCAVGDGALFTGIDLFESRQNGDGPGMSLKAAHKKLAHAKIKVRLIPGDPYSSLARCANSLAAQDLIVISADQDRESLERAWFYVPRMLKSDTVVLIEERTDEGPVFKTLAHDEINKRAQTAKPRRAA